MEAREWLVAACRLRQDSESLHEWCGGLGGVASDLGSGLVDACVLYMLT